MGDTRGKETEAGTEEEEEEEDEGKLHIAREESQGYVTEENDDRSDITGRRYLSDTVKANVAYTSSLTKFKDNNTKKDDPRGAAGRPSEEHGNEDIAVSNVFYSHNLWTDISESLVSTLDIDYRIVICEFLVCSNSSNLATFLNFSLLFLIK